LLQIAQGLVTASAGAQTGGAGGPGPTEGSGQPGGPGGQGGDDDVIDADFSEE